jgi:hypothetical protein
LAQCTPFVQNATVIKAGGLNEMLQERCDVQSECVFANTLTAFSETPHGYHEIDIAGTQYFSILIYSAEKARIPV